MSWIIEEIEKRGGEVTFDIFMELALYHPQHGYYSGDEPRYGRGGDFLTAPTASEWYARVLARLLAAISADAGPLRLIDVASGDGAVIRGVFEELGTAGPDVLEGVVSVEKSEPMRRRQIGMLTMAPVGIQWAGETRDLELSTAPAVIHSSELFDALPVVRVVGSREGLEELSVGVSSGQLDWRRRPPRSKVVAYFEGHGITLEEGQIAEANLGAESLHAELLAASGDRGLSLTLDYGYEARRLYDPRGRRGGSLSTFRRHEFDRDPLNSPGDIDLTAHVNWDDLRGAANGCGWQEIGLWSLAEYLVRAGISAALEARNLGMEADLDANTVSERQEVKRLLDPEGMGSDLKMLVQAKGDMVDIAKRVLELD
jgi:SAM-dependent MidA family methyltransferase